MNPNELKLIVDTTSCRYCYATRGQYCFNLLAPILPAHHQETAHAVRVNDFKVDSTPLSIYRRYTEAYWRARRKVR